MDARLKELGRTLARAQDAEPPLDLRAQRARFLEHASRPSPWTRLRLPALATSALACAVLCLLLVRGPSMRRTTALTFEVAGAPLKVGSWLAAPGDAALPVRFSDGSALRLSAASRARVVETSVVGARVVLERGQVRVAIEHRPRSDYRFEAGPFEVRVVGTRFELSWDPVAERFALSLQEGAVRVSGPGVGAARLVRAGQRLELFAAASGAWSAADPSGGAAAAGEGAGPTADSAPDAHDTGARDEPPAATDLAAARTTRAAASRPESLLRRADDARFSGRPERAVAALLALRARFGRTLQAQDSAFLLGRVYADQLADPEQAARWFQRSLRERASGPFAREAGGRLIESYLAQGDAQRASLAAIDYLTRYPDGPHAPLARKAAAARPVPH